MTPVSRDASAQSESGASRKYVSGYRRAQGEATREAIVNAALVFIDMGVFRPEARDIANLAQVHQSSIVRHFGTLALLYKVIAREHAAEVLAALGLEPMDDARTVALQRDLVWIAMTGRRKPAS